MFRRRLWRRPAITTGTSTRARTERRLVIFLLRNLTSLNNLTCLYVHLCRGRVCACAVMAFQGCLAARYQRIAHGGAAVFPSTPQPPFPLGPARHRRGWPLTFLSGAAVFWTCPC